MKQLLFTKGPRAVWAAVLLLVLCLGLALNCIRNPRQPQADAVAATLPSELAPQEDFAMDIPEGQHLRITMTKDEDADQVFETEVLGGNFSQGMRYFRVKDVLYVAEGNHSPLETALSLGLISQEEIYANLRQDAREGYCDESYESRHGVTGVTFQYPEFSVLWMDDVYEMPNGEQYPIGYLGIYDPFSGSGSRYYLPPTTGFVDPDTGERTDREDWGLEFEVLEADSDGITLRCRQFGGQQIGSLSIGWYHLRTGDSYAFRVSETVPDPRQAIPMEQESEIHLDWTQLYGPQSSGDYTLLLDIDDEFDETQVHPFMEDYYTSQQYVVEFRIP